MENLIKERIDSVGVASFLTKAVIVHPSGSGVIDELLNFLVGAVEGIVELLNGDVAGAMDDVNQFSVFFIKGDDVGEEGIGNSSGVDDEPLDELLGGGIGNAAVQVDVVGLGVVGVVHVGYLFLFIVIII